MAGAGAITHSMVPPTPGPLMIADQLKIELGIAMMAGLAASILPAWLVLFMSKKVRYQIQHPHAGHPRHIE
jgi:GntP family gluconate:H+ symporter